MQYKLTLEKRDESIKLETLRKSGKMPAVIYGPKIKTTSVAVKLVDFEKAFKGAGESSVVELRGLGEDHDALIHAVDFDPVTDIARHADFYIIEKGKKVQVSVPVVFVGVAPAVKEKGGILVKVMRELKIEASPKDLPHEINIDIAPLTELDSRISARDIKMPTGVTLLTHGEETVVSIAQMVEEKEEAPTAVDMSAIEVEKKGKEAKEGEAGAEGETADAGKADSKDAKKEKK
ncbi:MAG: 50S ribosomal protein L25 [bacterium]|nr:50S ribosomal protein L25 [bacterium]